MSNVNLQNDKAYEWWGSLDASIAQYFRTKYYPGYALIAPNDIVYIYQCEHPEQTNSVVSIEGKREMAERLHKMFLHGNLSPYDIALKAADWQKEQYSSLLSSYRKLLEVLNFIVNDVPEAGEDAVLSVNGYNKASKAIQDGNNILKQFNQ